MTEPLAQFSTDFICRTARLPASAIDGFAVPEYAELAETILKKEEYLTEMRSCISEILHAVVGNATDKSMRQRYINIRRDLFNLRDVTHEAIEFILDRVPQDDLNLVRPFCSSLKAYHELLRSFAKCCTRSLEIERAHLESVTRHPDFQRGLVLASMSLYRRQANYAFRPFEDLTSGDRKLERSLLQYMTRMSMKATPFGTFCAISQGAFQPSAGNTHDPTWNDGSIEPVTSWIRLSKAIYGVLMIYLRQSRNAQQHMFGSLNPTLRKIGETFHYVHVEKRRESVRELQRSIILDDLVSVLSNSSRQTGAELVRYISDHPQTDTTRDEAEKYVATLSRIGLLQFDTGIPGYCDDWPERLVTFLEEIDADWANSITTGIERLTELRDQFAQAAAAGRAELLEQMTTNLSDLFRSLSLTTHVKIPLFEDTSSSSKMVIHRTPHIRAIERDLATYIELTRRLAPRREIRAGIRQRLDTLYAESEKVSLLSFYEDFYRENKYADLSEYASSVQGNTFISAIRRARRNIRSLIDAECSRHSDCNSITISSSDLERAISCAPPMTDPSWSMSLFCEIVPSAGSAEKLTLCMRNGTYKDGYGRFMGRFLYMFEGEARERLRRENMEDDSGLVLAKISSDANFNANLHPDLFRSEILYPLEDPRGSGTPFLVRDLFIARDKNTRHDAVLIHGPSAKRVLPINGGLMALNARPELYRMIMAFSPTMEFSFPFPSKISDPKEDSPQVVRRPRVWFGDSILLSREQWIVGSMCFPVMEGNEAIGDYNFRLLRWCRQHGIPDRVYVRIRPHVYRSDSIRHKRNDAETIVQRDADALKPQFMDFRSPILVSLLNSIAPVPDGANLVLEECFPPAQSLLTYAGARHVSELVMQITR